MTPSEKKHAKKQAVLARPELQPALRTLWQDFARGRLTLYLGAGVSRESGLPSWNTLIAFLYYSAVNADWAPRWIAFPNYLYALGEWLLRKSGDSPEVIAGKIESYWASEWTFAMEFKRALYLPWRQTNGRTVAPSAARLREGNALLDAVATLCEATDSTRGLHAVVTTNYDSLLEQALSGRSRNRFKPIWKSATKMSSRKKGIFHVHGYVPAKGSGSPYEDIMLTEAQYHRAASDPYSWSNLTLIRCFSASTGLMIGMSMTDRNLRRLLHALHGIQLKEKQYVILKAPKAPTMKARDMREVEKAAFMYAKRFEGSGIKTRKMAAKTLPEILKELVKQEKTMAERSLKNMGVTPLWVQEHAEIPFILEAVGAL